MVNGYTCGVLLVLCIVLAAGWGRAAKNTAELPEVRNNGTAIQWKYADGQEWHDLVTLETLKGAAGEKGADGSSGRDGKDGENGKDGADGRSIEVKRTDSHIQWRHEGGQWQDLVALCDITGPSGQQGTPGADGKTPEFRAEGNMLQWRYCGSDIWLNLFDLSVLKGQDGQNGSSGKDGADGNTPFIGENGTWWIGNTDTGIKAAGTDGEKGDKGDKGEKGDRGEKGEKGDAGQNGACAGYFYAEARCVPVVVLSQGSADIKIREKINSGGLISAYKERIALTKGHIYSLSISGSLEVTSNEFNNSGNYSIQMTDGYDDDFCREVTRIKRDGAKIPQTKDQYSFNFTRIYDASDKDITLEFWFEQSAYNTVLHGFKGNIVITALN